MSSENASSSSSSSSSLDATTGLTVCVTGAGGFIASWLVKLLLQRGYTVHGTARDPDDPKNDHLKELEGAKERLRLFKADLLDYQSFRTAISGCQGVFHTASPVTDDPEKMIEPVIKGTENVIAAAVDAGVKRLVFTSSIGTVYMDPSRNADNVVDESCWSNLDYCKNTRNWYCYGKTVAEKVAWGMAAERRLDLVVINPVLVIGPLLQPTMNASTAHIFKYLNGDVKTYANAVQAYVHVRDVAEAHVLVFESPAASGRYICGESMLHRGELVDLLRLLFPSYPIPTRCKDEVNPRAKPYTLSAQKIKDMGLKFTPMKKTLHETVTCLEKNGYLQPHLSAD